MNRRNLVFILFLLIILAFAPVFSACGSKDEEEPPQHILEPGLNTPDPGTPKQPVTPIEEPDPIDPDVDENDFIDLGRATTLDDLMANRAKIHSYYFEQTITASYGDLFVRTWYADGMMKKVSTFEDGEENIEYVDCENMFLVLRAPATADFGIFMSFEPGDPDMPDNHLSNDYHQYRLVDTDTINGQICRVLENRQGEKLWVSTKHGFPLQVEFNDPTNEEHFILTYQNIMFNQTDYEDVAIPDDLLIVQY